MKEMFEPVLTNNEELIKVIKPNKVKTILSLFLVALFLIAFVAIFTLIIFLVPSVAEEPQMPLTILIVLESLYGLALILSFVFSIVYYKNRFYALTNKRLIIRSGILGIDFKSLDFDKIGAIDVQVSVVDKILARNTGSVKCGSAASPLVNNQSGYFYLSNVEKPYELYKEIQHLIEEIKNKK